MFFKPVFNIADAAISAGVINILLFQRSFFSGSDKKNEEAEEVAVTVEVNDEVEVESEVKQEEENQQQEDEVKKDENELL
jgi:signal peptidase II